MTDDVQQQLATLLAEWRDAPPKRTCDTLKMREIPNSGGRYEPFDCGQCLMCRTRAALTESNDSRPALTDEDMKRLAYSGHVPEHGFAPPLSDSPDTMSAHGGIRVPPVERPDGSDPVGPLGFPEEGTAPDPYLEAANDPEYDWVDRREERFGPPAYEGDCGIPVNPYGDTEGRLVSSNADNHTDNATERADDTECDRTVTPHEDGLDDHDRVVLEHCLVESEADMVNKPSHYQNGLGVEVIDIIYEYFRDNYNLGNTIKYLLRADKKGKRQQDLEKAYVYLGKEIEHGRGA